jgi:hypothetical protein
VWAEDSGIVPGLPRKVLGMVVAVGIVLGMFEVIGWEFAGPVNPISYLLWAVWLVIVGVQLLRREC